MSEKPKSAINGEHAKSLIKEAILLANELKVIDKKIESDLEKQTSALVKWVESTPVVKLLVEEVADEIGGLVLEKLFTPICILLGIGVSATVKGVEIIFSSNKTPNARMARLDNGDPLSQEYEKKKYRLQEIYLELFRMRPPSPQSLLQNNYCDKDTCWRAETLK